jgi:hypothetical protein
LATPDVGKGQILRQRRKSACLSPKLRLSEKLNDRILRGYDMPAAPTHPKQNSSLAGLSLLALEAAMDLDRLIDGTSNELRSVDAFFGLLDHSGDSALVAGSPRQLANPKTLDALNRAFRDTNVSVKTTDDIRALMLEYMKTFTQNRKAGNVNALQLLKRFFIALHNELLADNYRIRVEGRSRSREERVWIL